MKKILSSVLTVFLLCGVPCCSALAIETSPTFASVIVDGKKVNFDAYTINDNNYFKLRDLAYVLNGTMKQFNVEYNQELNAIMLTSEKPYISVGGEMKLGDNKFIEATPTASKIFKDGTAITLTAYSINDNNYFKLRDIGETFNFGVDWEESSNAIIINTSKGYSTSLNDSKKFWWIRRLLDLQMVLNWRISISLIRTLQRMA